MSSETGESSLQLDLLAWFEINKRRLGAAFALFILVSLAVLVWRWNVQRTEASASQSLLELYSRLAATSGQEEKQVSGQDLLQVVASHGGTQAAERALLLGAGQLFAEGRYAEAREKFDAFIQQHAGSPFAATAALGAAASLDALDKTTEALEAYQRIATQFSTDPVAARARLSRARLLEAGGKPSEALSVYEDLTKTAPSTQAGQQAALRREALLRRHPELIKIEPAPTNAPAAMTVTPAPAAPPNASPASPSTPAP